MAKCLVIDKKLFDEAIFKRLRSKYPAECFQFITMYLRLVADTNNGECRASCHDYSYQDLQALHTLNAEGLIKLEFVATPLLEGCEVVER